jgi:epoxyqueuosine reductase
MENISLSLKNSLEKKGLKFLGVVSLDCRRDFDRFSQWLEEKKHGGLSFLENNNQLRRDPSLLLPGAQAAVIVGMPYQQAEQWPMESEMPRVAQYARFRDYHQLLRKMCAEVLKVTSGYQESEWRVCVDSAPVLERALASKSGSGFIGKNTCFIHPQHGSFLLLAELLTTLALPVEDKNGTDGCGSCSLCQVHCPTDALSKDYEIDSRRCLSYWTIEHRGTIPEEFWPWLSKYYFGCDICQIVCPYNQEASNRIPPSVELKSYPELFEVATMDQESYERHFGGTPLTRAKRTGLIRNALIAMKVTNHSRLSDAMARVSEDPDPMLQATLKQLRHHVSMS